jgi:hypothetical protein
MPFSKADSIRSALPRPSTVPTICAPRGFTAAVISAANTAICNQPCQVIALCPKEGCADPLDESRPRHNQPRSQTLSRAISASTDRSRSLPRSSFKLPDSVIDEASRVRLQASRVRDHFANVSLLAKKAMDRVQRTHVFVLLVSLDVASVKRLAPEEIPTAAPALAATT